MCEWIDKLWKKRQQFITPIQVNKDNEYINKLDNVFSSLIIALQEVKAEEFYLDVAKKYQNELLESVKLYYSGQIDKAQQKIDGLIIDFKDDSIAISGINSSISFECQDFLCERVEFFRARCNSKYINYRKEEMLHIPFSKRSIVKTERFSVPGLPCLYLGTTSYVCWLELGCPADHEFNVSPIVLDNTQRIFNLAVNFKDFINTTKHGNADLKIVFQLLLLSITTSFNIKEENRSFKSEYIVSQLIMMACMKRGLSGLTYYSKQVVNDVFARSIGVNVALFAKYSEETDLSSICNHMCISDSYNYLMYKNLLVPQKFMKAGLRIDKVSCIQNIGTFSRQHSYRETEFYNFDNYLFAYLEPKELFHT